MNAVRFKIAQSLHWQCLYWLDLYWQGNGASPILPRRIHPWTRRLEVQLIGSALTYLRDKVNTHLQGGEPDSGPPLVVFIEGDKIDPLNIQSGRVNMLVVNIEEERELRGANPYYDGYKQRINPDIPLTISALFIARFNDYPTSWNYLTDIIRFFQSHPVLERADNQSQSSNNMPEGIESLRCEMISLNFQQQNEVWGALRITQHPALLYKIKLITLRDPHPQSSVETKNIIVKLMGKEKAEAIDTMIDSNTT